VLCNNEIIWFIGELHPTFLEAQWFDGIYKIAYAAFELEKLFALRGSKENKPYESLQDQLVNRDLSFELETLSSFEKIIWVFMSSESVHHFEVIDLYRQDNSEIKSITINFEILWDGALTTEAINTHMNQIIIDVEKTWAKLKGARRE
jgi:phenylalanyl-tRNA synthetase beta subunit